jgi:hypothetical protein
MPQKKHKYTSIANLPEKELLKAPLRSLDLKWQGTWLEKAFRQLFSELRAKDLSIPLYFWLSNEWFSPDGTTGIAIPFYLAHPRLIRLEQKHTGEVEGKDFKEIMRYLRHECGHVIENLYGTRRLKSRRQVFGSSKQAYPKAYQPKRYSKKFVKNLKDNYAQAHPDEDFAETFAVWLDPNSNWQEKYQNWPAIEKLNYMDELMTSLTVFTPAKKPRIEVTPLKELRKCLGSHYRYKKSRWDSNTDQLLSKKWQRILPANVANTQHWPEATEVLKSHRAELIVKTSQSTGAPRYLTRRVVMDLEKLVRKKPNRWPIPYTRTKRNVTEMLAKEVSNYLRKGYFEIAM